MIAGSLFDILLCLQRIEENLQAERPAPWPITIEEAADRLHCGVRWLKDHLKHHPIGRRAGKSIIFSEEDYAALYQSLPGSSEFDAPTDRRPDRAAAPSEATVTRKLQALIAASKRKRRT